MPETPWQVTPEELRGVTTYLDEHFPGGHAATLTEPTDPGQLFTIRDREGQRYTLKLAREVFDDLRRHHTAVAAFLNKHRVAHRMRHARRVVVLATKGEDMIREERD